MGRYHTGLSLPQTSSGDQDVRCGLAAAIGQAPSSAMLAGREPEAGSAIPPGLGSLLAGAAVPRYDPAAKAGF